MKLLTRLLSFAICWQFIFAPFADAMALRQRALQSSKYFSAQKSQLPSLNILNLLIPSAHARQNCERTHRWDSSLNRCVLKEEVHQDQRDPAACEEDENPQACLMENAIGDEELAGCFGESKGGALSTNMDCLTGVTITQAIIVFVTLIYGISRATNHFGTADEHGDGLECSTSHLFMQTAAISIVVGEIIAWLQYASVANNAFDSYARSTNVNKTAMGYHGVGSDVSRGNIVAIQKKAYKHIIQLQEAYIKSLKTKKATAYVSGSIYAAAAVLALFESIHFNKMARGEDGLGIHDKGVNFACNALGDNADLISDFAPTALAGTLVIYGIVSGLNQVVPVESMVNNINTSYHQNKKSLEAKKQYYTHQSPFEKNPYQSDIDFIVRKAKPTKKWAKRYQQKISTATTTVDQYYLWQEFLTVNDHTKFTSPSIKAYTHMSKRAPDDFDTRETLKSSLLYSLEKYAEKDDFSPEEVRKLYLEIQKKNPKKTTQQQSKHKKNFLQKLLNYIFPSAHADEAEDSDPCANLPVQEKRACYERRLESTGSHYQDLRQREQKAKQLLERGEISRQELRSIQEERRAARQELRQAQRQTRSSINEHFDGLNNSIDSERRRDEQIRTDLDRQVSGRLFRGRQTEDQQIEREVDRILNERQRDFEAGRIDSFDRDSEQERNLATLQVLESREEFLSDEAKQQLDNLREQELGGLSRDEALQNVLNRDAARDVEAEPQRQISGTHNVEQERTGFQNFEYANQETRDALAERLGEDFDTSNLFNEDGTVNREAQEELVGAIYEDIDNNRTSTQIDDRFTPLPEGLNLENESRLGEPINTAPPDYDQFRQFREQHSQENWDSSIALYQQGDMAQTIDAHYQEFGFSTADEMRTCLATVCNTVYGCFDDETNNVARSTWNYSGKADSCSEGDRNPRQLVQMVNCLYDTPGSHQGEQNNYTAREGTAWDSSEGSCRTCELTGSVDRINCTCLENSRAIGTECRPCSRIDELDEECKPVGRQECEGEINDENQCILTNVGDCPVVGANDDCRCPEGQVPWPNENAEGYTCRTEESLAANCQNLGEDDDIPEECRDHATHACPEGTAPDDNGNCSIDCAQIELEEGEEPPEGCQTSMVCSLDEGLIVDPENSGACCKKKPGSPDACADPCNPAFGFELKRKDDGWVCQCKDSQAQIAEVKASDDVEITQQHVTTEDSALVGIKVCYKECSSELDDDQLAQLEGLEGEERQEAEQRMQRQRQRHGSAQVSDRSIRDAEMGEGEVVQCTETSRTRQYTKNARDAAGRLIISTAASGASFILAKILDGHIKNAEELLEKIKDKEVAFEGASGGLQRCTPDDRSNPDADRFCYCYLESGARNPDRSNSEKCQAAWSDLGMRVSATDYSRDMRALPSLKACVTRQGHYDPGCKCQSMQNDEGQNFCYQVNPASLNLPGMGTASWASQMIDRSNSLTGGRLAPSNLNTSGLMNQARSMRRDLAKNLVNNPEIAGDFMKHQQGMKRSAKPNPKSASQMSRGFGGGGGFGAGMGAGGAGALGSDIGKKLLEKVPDGDKLAPGGSSSKRDLASIRGKKKSKKDAWDAFGNSQSKGGGVTVDEVMKKDFDYRSNDINKNNSVSIFKILTNRYHQSAMRRLFDDEGLMEAEEASETQIHR